MCSCYGRIQGHSPACQASKRRYWERHPEARARNIAMTNPRRVFGASGYLGAAPRADQAADLNQMARDFRAQQKGRA